MKERKFLSFFVCLLMVAAVFAVVPMNVSAYVNNPPVADAGPDQSAVVGETVTLWGSASDVDGDEIVSWLWTIESAPPGSTATIIPSSHPRFPTITPDVDGTYIISLAAYDGMDWGPPSTTTVTATLPTYVEIDDDFGPSTPHWGVSRFDMIQDGVDAVDVGGTVYVYSGIYNEEVVIPKTLTLEGENKVTTIIQGSGTGNGIYSYDISDITINNFDIRGFYSGIYLSHSAGSTVSGNEVSNNINYGIYLSGSAGNTISGNTASDNHHGIHLLGGGNTVSGNTVSNNNGNGINLDYSHSNTITGNTASGNERGISLWKSNSNTMNGNTVSDNLLYGIFLHYSISNTLSGNTVSGNRYGIDLSHSDSTTLSENTVSDSLYGIAAWISDSNTMYENTVTGSSFGIHLYHSGSNTLTENTMLGNAFNFDVRGNTLSHYIQYIDTTNMVNDKPIYYWLDHSDESIPLDAGYVGIVDSDHITVQDLILSNNGQGVLLAYSTDSTIQNVVVSDNYFGIHLHYSGYNTISENTASDNLYGISLDYYSSYNTIFGNSFPGNEHFCIWLQFSNNNLISENTITAPSSISYELHYGIYVYRSDEITISGNTVSDRYRYGIFVGSDNTIISGNTISGTQYDGVLVVNSNNNMINRNTISGNYGYGIRLTNSNSIIIYHNNIIDNFMQASDTDPMNNHWHHPELLEGNFWSDYPGVDDGSGTGKHEIAGDRIGDTAIPYPTTDYDFYPFTEPDVWLNAPPVANAGGPYFDFEGTEVTFDASGSTDPDGDPLQYHWDFDGDGTWDTDWSDIPYAEFTWNDEYTGTVTVEVSDGSLTATATAGVTIDNADPIITSITSPIDPIPIDTPTDISAPFTDPGTSDFHFAQINWGDGAITDGVVDETGGSGTVTGHHTYGTPGVYIITLTVWDYDGGEDSITTEYVVIFDPTGAFVTGGGMIDSPEGAYTPDPSLTGKAGFGFVSKYQKGASVPDGNTQFRFQTADLKFQSTSYDWMVVAGPKAMFKGTGTINGGGNYGFLILAVDGDMPGGNGVDKFRIKIWDKDNFDTVVYDNGLGDAEDADPPTELTHGSIKIHKA